MQQTCTQFSRNLDALMRHERIRAEDIAAVSGYSTSAISHWRRGLSAPDIRVLPLLCEMLHVSAAQLLGMDE